MNESRRPGPDGSGRSGGVLVAAAESVYRMIEQAPDMPPVSHGDTGGPEMPNEDGDRRPDPDWRLVGLVSFMFGFTAYTAAHYGKLLVRLML